jgi:hypothetical protein
VNLKEVVPLHEEENRLQKDLARLVTDNIGHVFAVTVTSELATARGYDDPTLDVLVTRRASAIFSAMRERRAYRANLPITHAAGLTIITGPAESPNQSWWQFQKWESDQVVDQWWSAWQFGEKSYAVDLQPPTHSTPASPATSQSRPVVSPLEYTIWTILLLVVGVAGELFLRFDQSVIITTIVIVPLIAAYIWSNFIKAPPSS